MNYFVHVRGRTFRVRWEDGSLTVDGTRLEADLAEENGTPVRSARVEGRSLRVLAERNGRGSWSIEVEGVRYPVEVFDAGEEAIRKVSRAVEEAAGPIPLRAPMPGLVVRVEVSEGDRVGEGDGLVIVEAMKMENELRATRPGTVRRVLVAAGQTVEKDQVLIELEPMEDSR